MFPGFLLRLEEFRPKVTLLSVNIFAFPTCFHHRDGQRDEKQKDGFG